MDEEAVLTDQDALAQPAQSLRMTPHQPEVAAASLVATKCRTRRRIIAGTGAVAHRRYFRLGEQLPLPHESIVPAIKGPR
ncbi:hypothetical protein ACQP2F_36955 [Actinoplanes sp. CA-030573]|uniref:hypothetical protein n=1 Tax=Actinoplanes sp. CA-030573 TaxID=3239898 RepID=UPI003D8FF3F6